MTKLRNAVLAAALTVGIGGAGVLAAAPAYAYPIVRTGSGTMVPVTGQLDEELDVVMTGPAWTFTEPVRSVSIRPTFPQGAQLLKTFNGVPGVQGALGNGSPTSSAVIGDVKWTLYTFGTELRLRGDYLPAGTGFDSITIPTLQLGQTTGDVLEGKVTYDLLEITEGDEGGVIASLVDDEVQPSATFTWTDEMVSIPVIAPAIGGAAAVAGLGAAGIVLIRRRRAHQTPQA